MDPLERRFWYIVRYSTEDAVDRDLLKAVFLEWRRGTSIFSSDGFNNSVDDYSTDDTDHNDGFNSSVDDDSTHDTDHNGLEFQATRP